MKAWRNMPEAEISKIKNEQCFNCIYFDIHDRKSGKALVSDTCNYAIITGRCRHCSPLECKKKGFYTEKKKRRGQKPRKGVLPLC